MDKQEPLKVNILDSEAFIKQNRVEEVTSFLIHDSTTGNFHPEGLYSEEIFGETTSEVRMKKFGYIDLHTPIIHPKLFRNLIRLKRFYKEIMSGSSYAIFNEQTGELERATSEDENADTGYGFFMKVLPDLKFPESKSVPQQNRVKSLEKNRDQLTQQKWLVIPAGIRDYKIDESGRGTSEDVNKLYVNLLHLTQSIDERNPTNRIYDGVRWAIQRKTNELFEYIEAIVSGREGGKYGYMQKKYGDRDVALATRNVISAATFEGKGPSDPRYHRSDTTKIPLVLACSAFAPAVTYQMRHTFINHVINRETDQVAFIKKDTWEKTYEPMDEQDRSLFTTSEGSNKLIRRFRNRHFRDMPIEIHDDRGNGYWLTMIYNEGENYYWFLSWKEFFDSFLEKNGREPDPSKVRPLTYAEMFYVSAYEASKDKFVTVTRYPAIEMGSTYISRVYVNSTTPSVYAKIKGVDIDINLEFPEYPIPGNEYVDSTILHPSMLTGLGADYDGDMVNTVGVMNKESLEECEEYMKSPASVLDADGELSTKIGQDVTKLVVHVLSK